MVEGEISQVKSKYFLMLPGYLSQFRHNQTTSTMLHNGTTFFLFRFDFTPWEVEWDLKHNAIPKRTTATRRPENFDKLAWNIRRMDRGPFTADSGGCDAAPVRPDDVRMRQHRYTHVYKSPVFFTSIGQIQFVKTLLRLTYEAAVNGNHIFMIGHPIILFVQTHIGG